MECDKIVIQIADNVYACKVKNEFGRITYGSVGNPILADSFYYMDGKLPQTALIEINKVFPAAKFVRIAINYEIEDVR